MGSFSRHHLETLVDQLIEWRRVHLEEMRKLEDVNEVAVRKIAVDLVFTETILTLLANYNGSNLKESQCQTLERAAFNHFVHTIEVEGSWWEKVFPGAKDKKAKTYHDRSVSLSQQWSDVVGVLSKHRATQIVNFFFSRIPELPIEEGSRAICGLSKLHLTTSTDDGLKETLEVVKKFYHILAYQKPRFTAGRKKVWKLKYAATSSLASILHGIGDEKRDDDMRYREWNSLLLNNLIPACEKWTRSKPIKRSEMGCPLYTSIVCCLSRERHIQHLEESLKFSMEAYSHSERGSRERVISLSSIQRLMEVYLWRYADKQATTFDHLEFVNDKLVQAARPEDLEGEAQDMIVSIILTIAEHEELATFARKNMIMGLLSRAEIERDIVGTRTEVAVRCLTTILHCPLKDELEERTEKKVEDSSMCLTACKPSFGYRSPGYKSSLLSPDAPKKLAEVRSRFKAPPSSEVRKGKSTGAMPEPDREIISMHIRNIIDECRDQIGDCTVLESKSEFTLASLPVVVRNFRLSQVCIPEVGKDFSNKNLAELLCKNTIHFDAGVRNAAFYVLDNYIRRKEDFRPYIINQMARFVSSLPQEKTHIISNSLSHMNGYMGVWIRDMRRSDDSGQLGIGQKDKQYDELDVYAIESMCAIGLCTYHPEIR